MSCTEQEAVAAYALGTLPPAERERVHAHVETCPVCQAALQEFAGLPGLLSRLTPTEAAAGPARPDEDAFQRLLSAAATHRRTTRRRRLVAVAAAVVLLASGTAAAVTAWPQDHKPLQDTVAAAAGPVRARVTVTETDTGSRLSLALSGVAAGQWCRLVAVDANGRREVAGSWQANYAGSATITGTTAVAPQRLDRLVVEGADGRELVSIPVRTG